MDSFAVFILAHEDFAHSLKSTAEKIIGPQPNLYPYSNKKDDLPIIFEKINGQITALKSNRIYVLVDLIGGSCWSLANMISKEHPEIITVGGVNLPMVISLIINHEKLDMEQLTDKIIEDSKKGISVLGRY